MFFITKEARAAGAATLVGAFIAAVSGYVVVTLPGAIAGQNQMSLRASDGALIFTADDVLFAQLPPRAENAEGSMMPDETHIIATALVP